MIDDVFACSTRLLSNIDSNFSNHIDYYFVVAHTLNGARYYSEPCTQIEAANFYYDYVNLVQYFGGGTVEILHIKSNDYDVVAYLRI